MNKKSNRELAEDFQRWRKEQAIKIAKQAEVDRKYPTRYFKNYLKNKYNITIEQYDEMLQKQNECCAVCGQHYTVFKKRLSVDHDHRTGEIRGLLCTYCNTHTIGRERDPQKMFRAAEYLTPPFTGWFVPRQTTPHKRSNVAKSYTEYFFNDKKDESPK